MRPVLGTFPTTCPSRRKVSFLLAGVGAGTGIGVIDLSCLCPRVGKEKNPHFVEEVAAFCGKDDVFIVVAIHSYK
jgi:hypothetical protein